jgi:hypothetical protein
MKKKKSRFADTPADRHFAGEDTMRQFRGVRRNMHHDAAPWRLRAMTLRKCGC